MSTEVLRCILGQQPCSLRNYVPAPTADVFSSISEIATKLDVFLLSGFFLTLFFFCNDHMSMFVKRYGRRHRICGLIHLILLVLGVIDITYSALDYEDQKSLVRWRTPVEGAESLFNPFLYHVILAISGTALTLTAAFDFRAVHEKKTNLASGPLEKDATVTYAEMIEHSFYQGLNLFQISFIHLNNMYLFRSKFAQFLGLAVVTAPWLVRNKFPYNKFSDNYSKGQKFTIYTLLYRIKKYQYVFYKHFVLHGINFTLLLAENGKVPITGEENYFKCFWLCLNTAYVMEFFLQSLVKRRILKQDQMLLMNQSLMVIGSIAGVFVLANVNFVIGFISMMLNFNRRGHDFSNTMFLAAASLAIMNYAATSS